MQYLILCALLAPAVLAAPLATPCLQAKAGDEAVVCNVDGDFLMAQTKTKCVVPATGELMPGYVQFKANKNKCETICQRRNRKWAKFSGKNPVSLTDDGQLIVDDIGKWVPQCDSQTGHFLPRQETELGALCMVDVVEGVDDPYSFKFSNDGAVTESQCNSLAGVPEENAGLREPNVQLRMGMKQSTEPEKLHMVVTQPPTPDAPTSATTVSASQPLGSSGSPIKVDVTEAGNDVTPECEDEEAMGEAEPLVATEVMAAQGVHDQKVQIATTAAAEQTMSCEDEEAQGEEEAPEFEHAMQVDSLVLTNTPSAEEEECEDEYDGADAEQKFPSFEKAESMQDVVITDAPAAETVSCEDEEFEGEEAEMKFPEFEKALEPEPLVITAAPVEETTCEDEDTEGMQEAVHSIPVEGSGGELY